MKEVFYRIIMIKITKEIAEALSNLYGKGIGHYSYFGAIGSDEEFIIYYNEEDIDLSDPYLAHQTEFDHNGFLFIKLKDKSDLSL